MVKELEFENEGNWYKGHVEYAERIEHGIKLYTVSSFFEDKPYGMPWTNVTEENLENILSGSEKGLMKYLKKKAEENDFNTMEGKLKKKGYSSF